MQENYPDNLDLVMKTMEASTSPSFTPTSQLLVDLVSGPQDGHRPMPNLLHPSFASIGSGVINRMYSVTRNRGTICASTSSGNHPDFADVPSTTAAYVPHPGRRHPQHQRQGAGHRLPSAPSPAASACIAKNIFEDETSPVRISNNRAMMHLDTVFTQISVDKFTIHPGIMGP
ncbi:MAG: arginine deiminase family protein [Eggerthellaceae bacterium]